MAKRKVGKKMESLDAPLTEYPSIHYKRFFDKFPEIESLAINDWKLVHLIAYFCKRYEQYYGLKYSFKFDKPPTKSYEAYQISKISSMLSASPGIIKDYIDWFFETKIIIRKRKITSMAFMTDANTVNEYKFKKLLLGKNISIDRSTSIPPNYSCIIEKHGASISTYGELSFIKKCKDAGNIDQKYIDMLNELAKEGLDMDMLDKVK